MQRQERGKRAQSVDVERLLLLSGRWLPMWEMETAGVAGVAQSVHVDGLAVAAGVGCWSLASPDLVGRVGEKIRRGGS